MNFNIAKIKILNYCGVDLFKGIEKRGGRHCFHPNRLQFPNNRFLGTVNLKGPGSLNYKIHHRAGTSKFRRSDDFCAGLSDNIIRNIRYRTFYPDLALERYE